ncbi:phosphate signaling complex protein PhoU [Gordonia sp. (in: high G+C Gram-positive bacteria)]|uniref:phosphate signaling complex protein PhoU n=1 Tax=Gordonia sp. (in: high G+C Gram-positive bacteria) TaxID=84139 RepID=UPI0016902943|nr:phosphate signaling complex protein PhoU [Gordonia sp. (in: high G+C Gram-positive bacteria)]NLG46157.1 phosphate signaling complex protein PhoU [Gordonia sp. (in: high G+C Gram-positive bacteria)]
MRDAYQEQMAALNQTLGDMVDEVGVVMAQATQALLEGDLELAEKVISDHDAVAEKSAKAEDEAFQLLALQAPVAGDLRSIVSGFQLVAEIDRMGALALHVAKVARRRHPARVLPEEVAGYFEEMGRLAVELAHHARRVLENQDYHDALTLMDDDDAMDDLHRHLFTVMMDREWEHGVAAAVDVTLLGRYYERFADHAVLIARRVVFQATGKTPEQLLEAS